MTMWPSVGVVIPTHHRCEMLARAIATVRKQDYPGLLRVIVVYDRAEPDWRLAAAEPAVMVLPNRRGAGLAGARNTGIRALDTDLVAFCHGDDIWHTAKLRRQVQAMGQGSGGALFATCAIEVEFEQRLHPRLAGCTSVTVDMLARSRMAMLHSSGFLARREALLAGGSIGPVAEVAPGSRNEDWDLLIRAARVRPIVHVDEPLVRVLWGRTSLYADEYRTRISSLRWMMARHPEIAGSRAGAARVYGRLACWSIAAGDRKDAWHWTKRTVKVLSTLHRRGLGI